MLLLPPHRDGNAWPQDPRRGSAARSRRPAPAFPPSIRHGRAETRALLDGLERLPRLRLEYRGASLEEMDLDALLARRPQLALVDELAHTNAPGARHAKRFQDVLELLEAGIVV